MGNQAASLKKHIETAEKTGALNFAEHGLEKFPPELVKLYVEGYQQFAKSGSFQ